MTSVNMNNSATGSNTPPSPEMRCQYPSKRCDNPRTTKRGGGLHRLCAFHRERANKNQWLVDQRRRMRREREGAMKRRSSNGYAVPADLTIRAPEPAIDELIDADEPCTPLGEEDLKILLALLFDEDDDTDVSECGRTSDLSMCDFVL
ncbi:hypothetical protein Poli38472_001848 [Pythium oligandrum]|uniref:Uncharacterized protein n=1 Tax=Pythium oligandrum TaxID=41045 RepID=A0A8K1FS58_PYTOL|nr:hypothetical protein Poli38472_001848 [Pythium oligandrum]|eukprot:TMW69692.1 hypothetical protein Poli38472_001848 [Pythium oligandrum]